MVRTRHLAEESLHLVMSQDGGQALRFLGAQGINRSQVLVEHLAAAKAEGRYVFACLLGAQAACPRRRA